MKEDTRIERSTSIGPDDLQSRQSQILSSIKTFLVVISSSIVMLIAFRNTLTWHLQRFWGASGDFWQSQWDKVLYLFGDDAFNVSVIGSFFFPFFVYWFVGAIYTCIDYTGRPKFIMKYKIQETIQYPVPTSRLIKVVKQVLINQIMVGIPFTYFGYLLIDYRGYDYGAKLPTFQWVVFELSICILVEEVAFYYSHRLLHHPRIYKFIHKRHHEWTSPIAITAVYCHPVEHVFSNLLPVFSGPLILGSHTATTWLWASIAILSTLNAHSGFHLPFFPSPEAHDFHHLKFNQNFGVLGVLDRLHGTDSLFRKNQAYQRHIMLLSLVPIKEVIPDDGKAKNSKKMD